MQTILDLFTKDQPISSPIHYSAEMTGDYLQGLAEEAYRIFRRNYNRLEDNRNGFLFAVNQVMPKIPDHIPDRVSIYRKIHKEICIKLNKILKDRRQEALTKPLPTSTLPRIKNL